MSGYQGNFMKKFINFCHPKAKFLEPPFIFVCDNTLMMKEFQKHKQ